MSTEQQKNLIEMNRLVGDLIELVSDVFLTSDVPNAGDKQTFKDKVGQLDEVTTKVWKDAGLS